MGSHFCIRARLDSSVEAFTFQRFATFRFEYVHLGMRHVFGSCFKLDESGEEFSFFFLSLLISAVEFDSNFHACTFTKRKV